MKNEINNNIIYGRNPVKEALRANNVVKVYVTNSFSHKEISPLLKECHVPQIVKSIDELNKLANGGVHQGIAAEIKPINYANLDDILDKCNMEDNPTLVILDGINDPHNLGAIIRSCEIFGVKALLIGKHQQVPLNATVAKTSAGAINYVPVCLVGNLNLTIETLKQKGFWVVSADGSGDKDYNKIKYDFPTVLIIGSEGNGISQLLLKNSDYIVKIPMYGKVNSLNASVAAGILLAEIKR